MGGKWTVYTLFLVEDEALELELLRDHMDWTGLDIRIAGTARNGKRAWEQIQIMQPDIVLTDVRMPIMDGLRLASLIREQFDWMKVVFLSGHDEFAFVQSAIESGAVGYLLKPVDGQELAAAMAKVKEEVDKARLLRLSKAMLAEKHLERMLLLRDRQACEREWQQLAGLFPSFRDALFVSGLIVLDRSGKSCSSAPLRMPDHDEMAKLVRAELKNAGAEGVVARAGEGEWFVAVCADGKDAGSLWPRLSAAVRKAWGITVTIGAIDRPARLTEAPDLLREAREFADERFYLGHGRIVSAADVRSRNVEAASDHARLPVLTSLEDLPEAMEKIDGCFRDYALRRLPGRRLKPYLIDWLEGLSEKLAKYDDWPAQGAGGIEEWRREIAGCDTFETLNTFVLDLLRKVCDYIADKRRDRHARLVQEVVNLIEARYAEPLTIEYLAGRVYLSPNYLRALFKEKKGCTIHEYLTQVRLCRARELLRDRKLKIKDVARQVGYDNTSYFCSFFYKTQGVTPNEYRKRFL